MGKERAAVFLRKTPHSIDEGSKLKNQSLPSAGYPFICFVPTKQTKQTKALGPVKITKIPA
jgi:hypothetical protein